MAHLYEIGGMRRLHLNGRANILKRLLVHAGGFNLVLIMRKLVGVGKPGDCRGLLRASLHASAYSFCMLGPRFEQASDLILPSGRMR
jgi:transposase